MTTLKETETFIKERGAEIRSLFSKAVRSITPHCDTLNRGEGVEFWLALIIFEDDTIKNRKLVHELFGKAAIFG